MRARRADSSGADPKLLIVFSAPAAFYIYEHILNTHTSAALRSELAFACTRYTGRLQGSYTEQRWYMHVHCRQSTQ